MYCFNHTSLDKKTLLINMYILFSPLSKMYNKNLFKCVEVTDKNDYCNKKVE